MNTWLIFALLAPVFWGFSNVLDAAIRREFVKNDSAMTVFLAASRLPFIIAFFLIVGVKIPPIQAVIFMIIGGALWMFPFIFYYKALEFEEPSRVVLLMLTAPIFVLSISFFAINETLTIYQLLAFILIIVGGVFAAIKKLEGRIFFFF
ncbi:DMT family transporter [Candidatus Peregrinibacteria bacterium]|nr:DMT family transporter [Candidatus Peregrinibacteria bacterium]